MKSLRINAIIGGGLMAAFLLAAAAGQFWTPYDPMALDLRSRLLPPGAAHLLGTDEFGRDVLSRLLAASSTSLCISGLTLVFALLAGITFGALSGYFRGATDRVIMTFNDALLAFPSILMALALLAVLGANMFGIIVALGLAYTPSVVRVVRGTVMSLRMREFVEASRVMGNSSAYTVFRHILPNCLAPVIVLATSMFGSVLLAESALSFLGVGVPPPAPTWGNMLASARSSMEQAPWLGIFPGLCISLVLLGINLFGDSLRDHLDPRMKGTE